MVTVLLFAGIAEKLGKRSFQVEVGEGETVASLRDRLYDEYPELRPFGETLLFAVDEEYAQPGTVVPDGSTLALIPPVSGGSAMFTRVTDAILDPAEAIAAVADPSAGAIDVFLGVVRNSNRGRDVAYLEYDAYPPMAEKLMAELAGEAIEEFGLRKVAILHRIGRLEIGETSLLIAISSGHRAEAFAGGKWLVDEVKRRIPVWKKEVWSDGEEWIEGPESLGMQQRFADPAGS